MARCPNCGNTNPRSIEDNGCDPADEDYTLLCTARVTEDVTSIDVSLLTPEDYDDKGLVTCGMQWEPRWS